MSAPRLNQHTALDELWPRTPVDRVAARVLSRGTPEYEPVPKPPSWQRPQPRIKVLIEALDEAVACPLCGYDALLRIGPSVVTVGCAKCDKRFTFNSFGGNDIPGATRRSTIAWNRWACSPNPVVEVRPPKRKRP